MRASRRPPPRLRAVSSLDALMALQGVEDFKERKKRAVVKGRNALDALDALKLGLLDGSVDGANARAPEGRLEGLTEETGDAWLDSVMRRNRAPGGRGTRQGRRR